MAALLFANVKASLQPRWHWTADELDASYAWICYFDEGHQFYGRKSFKGSAVVVRYIKIGGGK